MRMLLGRVHVIAAERAACLRCHRKVRSVRAGSYCRGCRMTWAVMNRS